MLEGTGAPETLDPALLLDRIEEAFYAIDRDWRFHTINRKAEEFWGRPRAEMLGHSMLELFPRFLNSPPYEAHKRAMESDEPLRVETISTATGAPVEIRLYPSAAGLSVYFQDLSRRRQLESAIRSRDELLSLAELSAGIGVWELDLTTQTMTATAQYFHLLGVEPPVGAVPQDFVRSFRHPADRDRHTQAFREALAAGADTFEGEYRIVRPTGEVRWIFGRGRVTRDASGKPLRYAGVDLDITDRKQAEEHLRLVMNELLHRTNNLLAVVQGLAQQTVRSSATLHDFVPVFSARLQGLGQSSTLLAREEWRGAGLRELIEAQVTPFAEASRFTLEGPAVLLSPKAVQNLGLAFHELCTNAMKYGALSAPAGRVEVRWRVDGALHLSWKEIDGPPVKPPTRKGFGRVVSEQMIATSLGGTVHIDFGAAGIEWMLVLPANEFTTLPADQ